MSDTCWVAECTEPVALAWARRPTIEELEAELGPGPLPPVEETTWAVYACHPHGITPDLATMIHQATCRPDLTVLPLCLCTPEAPPYIPLFAPADQI